MEKRSFIYCDNYSNNIYRTPNSTMSPSAVLTSDRPPPKSGEELFGRGGRGRMTD